MNSLDKKYTDLLQDILDNGIKKKDRTGTGTISVFGRQIRHKMSEGFPLLTTKKMYFRGVVAELLWFLRGETNIKSLIDNDCHIWDGDVYKNYCKNFKPEEFPYYMDVNPQSLLPLSKEEFIERIKDDDEFAKKWGDLGPVYGKQWRNWGGYQKVAAGWEHGSVNHFKDVPTFDQIAEAIHKLNANPDDRGIIVSAWNVGELDKMVLRPCHNFFQFYTRELSAKERWDWYGKNGGPGGEVKMVAFVVYENEEDNQHIHEWLEKNAPNVPIRAISLMWSQRSCDTFLGLPFNVASYGLLLEIIAKMVNMVPDELIGNLGDTHLYLNHIEQAKEQIGRELSFDERVGLANNNDVAISNKMSDHSFAEIQLDNLGIPRRTREPYPLPTLKIVGYPDEYFHPYDVALFDDFEVDDFEIENYQSHSAIKAPLSN